MGADFTFRYHPAEHSYEVPEAASDFFVSLFDCDMELLKAAGLDTSFVLEYRKHLGATMMEEAQSMNEDEANDLFEDFDPEDMDPNDFQWGPSTPYAPEESLDWARTWILLIEEADDEILAEAFPYNVDMRTGKTTLVKQDVIEELRRVVAQAECAVRHDAQMTVQAVWS